MVCGTTSDSGKTTIVAGLCRLLARNGVRVAPFKAQNMALNSAVTESGHEIGRAQYLQAQAAGIPAEVAMNPVLLKPTGEQTSQVVVNGKPWKTMSAADYHKAKPELFDLVNDALDDLRSRFDVVLIEGAGSPAEINLADNDIVNLRLAERAALNAILVGDIDPGGVFASLFGTVKILPDNLSKLIGGFVINKFRGDPALLGGGTEQLQALTGVPTLGVVPMIRGLNLDSEDSLNLDRPEALAGPEGATSNNPSLDVAVVRLPQISNFTDLDPLITEPDLSLRWVRSARELGSPDMVVLSGSKATVNDLAWMRTRGLDTAITDLAATGTTTVIGLCAGYQMLGQWIDDDIESTVGKVEGLGLLPVATSFEANKVLRSINGVALDEVVTGYQIHHGRVRPVESSLPLETSRPEAEPWIMANGDENPDGFRSGNVWGSTFHGLFDSSAFRHRFLHIVAENAGTTFTPGTVSPRQHRLAELDRLADQLDLSLDMEALVGLISQETL